jgi:hypothetical protein
MSAPHWQNAWWNCMLSHHLSWAGWQRAAVVLVVVVQQVQDQV